MRHNENFLTVRNLTVEYNTDEGVVYAVNNVSFSMKKGETLGFVGETGAGKTTIARSILRILPMPPAEVKSGEILFQGEDLLKLSEAQMRKRRGFDIAMIFQDPMSALNPVITVGEQIAESIRIHQEVNRVEALRRAMKMLETVGIPGERYYNYPHEFSGGMKQRVIIAIALCCNPQLLLADEPTTALDVTIQAQVLEMMDKLKREMGTSMILITHDLGVVAKTCDAAAVLYGGQIVEYGSKVQIFTNALHPYTRGLFDSLPNLSTQSKRLNPIPGRTLNPMIKPKGCPFYDRCAFKTQECKEQDIPLTEIEPGHQVRCLHTGAKRGAF